MVTFKSTSRRRYFAAILLGCLFAGLVYAADLPPYTGPSNAELDAAREWLWAHPPDALNDPQRLEQMAVIEAAADQLPGKAARLYLVWANRNTDAYEREGALYYLRTATDRAIEDIRRTKVTHGLVLWQIYNMGYVFKTLDACFGVDICLKHGERLAQDLDFLLVTHEHGDHHLGGIIKGMHDASKPVITRFSSLSKVVKKPKKLRFGPIRVKVDVGDHSPGSGRSNDMLMFQIDCGEAAGNCVVYHSGDSANPAKMTPDRPVDIFIPHVSCGARVADAIRHIDPKFTLASHAMELTHNPGGARWTYEFAFDQVKDLPPEKVVILTWGERWMLPGSTFERVGEP